IKSFLTRPIDRYRPPYERRVKDVPRQCVFAGTVNEDTYLKDPTGGRRFWPVRCGSPIALYALKKDRDAIWAEARELYQAGHTWWPIEEAFSIEAANQQAERF